MSNLELARYIGNTRYTVKHNDTMLLCETFTSLELANEYVSLNLDFFGINYSITEYIV